MCEPILVGTAATATATTATGGTIALTSAGIPLATAAGMTVSTTAATAGLFGAGGAFSLGTTLSTLGTAFSAFNFITGGIQKSQQYKYQAQMMEYNAAIADNNAIAAKRAAEYEADVFRDRAKRVMSSQGPRYAKAGVVINEDTPLDVQVASAAESRADELAILYRGDLNAYSARTAAQGQRAAAANYQSQSGYALTAGLINAGAAVGRGAYNQYRKYGPMIT